MDESPELGTDLISVRAIIQRWGRPAGPILAVVIYLLLPSGYDAANGEWVALDHAARATLAIAGWMASWWLSEAIPVYATALLPLALFPILRVTTGKAAAAPYGHELIFLFMGGFLIALSMERWGLHRRMAFRVLQWVGTRPARVVAGFMLVSALLSMWVSNTATAIMMLPVGLSVIGDGDRPEDHQFALCLLLGIAYGCTIGGIATPIGTPPNVFLLSFISSELDMEIGFLRWMAIGVPLAALFLPLAWWLLTHWLFRLDDAPNPGAARLREAHASMGPMSMGEKSAAVAFAVAGVLWIGRPLFSALEFRGIQPFAGLTDAAIAMGAALMLFLLPGDRERGERALDWETALKLPWGILVLFGGGLSLAAAIRANGVDLYIGQQVAWLSAFPDWVVVVGVVTLIVFLTELTSNTATCATFVPLLAGMASGLGLDPLLLIVPAAIAASFAFMLPVATPPNAVIFGSGRVSIQEMSRAGLLLNLLAIALIPLLTFLIARPVLGIGG
jgi:sodium-dependent dicarboxylate transporter 2/3/5